MTTLHQALQDGTPVLVTPIPHSLYEVAEGDIVTIPVGHNLVISRRLRVAGRLRVQGRIVGIPPINSASSSGSPGSAAAALQEDIYTITPAILAAHGVALPKMPANPAKVQLIAFGGIEQLANVDFVVSGMTLNWAGLALDMLLSVGDRVAVRYVPIS